MKGANILGPGKEFDAIRALVARWGDRARHIGDDAAVLDIPSGERLVVSTDTSVEHIHFRREWLTAAEIGWRSTVAALSDLAAMGARPLGLVCAMAVPDSWRAELNAIGDGVGEACANFACPVVGGDLSTASELSITMTVLGTVVRPLLRSGARPGDALWLTGKLGGPRAALDAWASGRSPSPEVRSRFARPMARIGEGQWFAAHGCRCAIDVSDGLAGDARHVAAASNAALTIVLDAVPCVGGTGAEQAALSGEEYELLVAGPRDVDAADFVREFGIPLTRVGEVTDGPPEVRVIRGGERVEIAGGYDHFSP